MTTRIAVEDLSQVGAARRAADAVARACELDDTRRGVVGIVATEAATNLARHARAGALLAQSTAHTGIPGVEIVAADAGPGVYDLDRAFADGFSTGGTPGTGLGAIRRQADELDVYTAPGQGTIVLARVFATSPDRHHARDALVDVGAVCLPIGGEIVCGDGWAVMQRADRATILLVDGLGHGASAAEAADVAIAAFRPLAARPPREIVAALHDALRATRGAALAVADVTATRDGATVRYCGVGNTTASIVSDGPPRSLPSMNGTAGLQVRTTQEFSHPWSAGAMLVMHTDGITSRWRTDAYRGILARDPMILATALQRDHARGRDDATVLAFRLRAEVQR
ncbi:MAG TPA: ATP-binding protein [Gemmatimonadaceae bacterium]|nr:ATP-binding protein [Gemmatimonadaceae bacterium]